MCDSSAEGGRRCPSPSHPDSPGRRRARRAALRDLGSTASEVVNIVEGFPAGLGDRRWQARRTAVRVLTDSVALAVAAVDRHASVRWAARERVDQLARLSTLGLERRLPGDTLNPWGDREDLAFQTAVRNRRGSLAAALNAIRDGQTPVEAAPDTGVQAGLRVIAANEDATPGRVSLAYTHPEVTDAIRILLAAHRCASDDIRIRHVADVPVDVRVRWAAGTRSQDLLALLDRNGPDAVREALIRNKRLDRRVLLKYLHAPSAALSTAAKAVLAERAGTQRQR